MTFDELVAEVYIITKRPDLSAETSSAIRSATLKAHNSDFFSRDILQVEIAFEESNYLQTMDIYNSFPNYRALKLFKRYDKAAGPEYGTFITVVTADELLDAYGHNRADIAYVAGRSLNIRSSCAFQSAIMLAYMMPVLDVTRYSSWIAQLHPWAIINEACRVIFKMIGYDEQSAQYNTLVAEEYQLLTMTGLSDVGY
jgi:hypothetical protein